MEKNYRQYRLLSVGLLVGITVLVHAFYVLVARPQAEAWQIETKARAEQTAAVDVGQSFWVVIKDPEQECAIILCLWALGLGALKARQIRSERAQLEAGLMRVPAGFRILPTDVREHARTLETLPSDDRGRIVVRTIRRALKRFGETANVQDAATTTHDFCESEAARLDSELAPIRFCVWAIPAIGFVGTVRGIGHALQGAQFALRGDTSIVTGGLGVAFNSTFVALLLSILLMYVVHELQLAQERLVLDTEGYVDDTVISNLQAR